MEPIKKLIRLGGSGSRIEILPEDHPLVKQMAEFKKFLSQPQVERAMLECKQKHETQK